MRCERCGFKHVVLKQPKIENWPDYLPAPPPLPEVDAHPIGRCNSPFAVGDMVYWNSGGDAGNLPPIKAVFKELTTVAGPDFDLVDGEWDLVSDPKPLVAEIVVIEEELYPPHRPLLGPALDGPIEVRIGDLTAVDHWPVMML